MAITLDGTNGITGPATKAIVGTTTNDSAAAGYVGEYVSASSGSGAIGSSITWSSIASLSLTAGDWDTSLTAVFLRSGATWTEIYAQITSVANSGAGGTMGSNYVAFTPPPSTADYLPLAIPSYRVSISSTTTYYFNAYVSYIGGPPLVGYRISARRVR